MAFLTSSCLMQRNGQKNSIQKKKRGGGWQDFFFPQFFCNCFTCVFFYCGVFEISLLRNAQKRPQNVKFFKKKKERKVPALFSGYLPDIRRFQKKTSAPLDPETGPI
jgi:hypothetical protein